MASTRWMTLLFAAASIVALDGCGGIVDPCMSGSCGGAAGGTGAGAAGGTSASAGGGGSAGSGSAGGSGAVTQGTPTTLQARAVGAYAQIGSTCSGGAESSGYAMFLCPGGRLRGAGKLTSSITELMCGSYTTSPRTYSGCTDKVGCFDKVNATVKDTLILSGQQDVDPSFQFTMLMVDASGELRLWRPARCADNTTGYIVLERIPASVDTDDCVSAACPKPGGAPATGWGSCGTDCDCGQCWYCESGTCRYGGEGPYGCYRGCSG